MRFALSTLALLVSAYAAEKTMPAGQAANEEVEITATAFITKEAVKQLLGSDFGGGVFVVDVKVRPKGDHKFKLWRDDFLLRSSRDGQKSQPFEPSQLAGNGALVLSQSYEGGGVMAQDQGPVWGGIPGTMGGPNQFPGSGGSIGSGTASASVTETSMQDDGKEKDNPLLATLKQRILPEKEIDEATAGLLYFSMEGKHKPKDLELVFKGAGKVIVPFK
jgi:hypothetical protein